MKITLRPVTMADAEVLLGWKNDADTRKNAILTDAVIEMENHLVWLENRLQRGEFYIILLDGVMAGDVRIERDGSVGEISIRIDPKFRGNGLATQVIPMFGGELVAKIRAHNIPSMRVFIANGFKPLEYIEKPVPYYLFIKC